MSDFRVRILLESPCGTPLASGTLFGQFCWTLLQTEGEESFHKFFKTLEQEPMIFSDAMPAGFVPVPLLSRRAVTGDVVKDKELAKRQWVCWSDLSQHRHQLTPARLQISLEAAGEPRTLARHRIAHNRIDRITGSTPETGGLFFLDEDWPTDAGSEMDIYVRGEWEERRLERLFASMGKHGFGRDASTGRGRFRVLGMEDATSTLKTKGNRWMSWSRGCASEGMQSPGYRLYTHYGKLGGWFATSQSNPFKYPITLWRPGATFAAETTESGQFGRLLSGVHPLRPEVIHNAWHFAVAYTEVDA